MDKHRSRKMRMQRYALPAAVMLMAALSATVVSAYYTDLIKEKKVLIKAADIAFGDENGVITADTSGFDERLTPLKEGDSFNISFSALYSGDTDSFVVPGLKIRAEGYSEGDIIRVTDGESEIYIYEADGELYSLPAVVNPGDEIIKNYTVTIVKKNGNEPLSFKYDFSFAAVQKSGNEELYEKYIADGKRFHEAIESGEDIKGFSEVTEPEDVHDEAGTISETKYYKLIVEPEITEGYKDVNTYRWYLSYSGNSASANLISSDNRLLLVLNKKNIGNGIIIWLEAENEAGYVISEQYIITSENDISVKRKA